MVFFLIFSIFQGIPIHAKAANETNFDENQLEEKNNFLTEFTNLDENEEIDLIQIEEEFKEQFGEEISEEIIIEGFSESDDDVELTLGLDSLDDDFYAELLFDVNESAFSVSGESVDINGELVYYEYDIVVEESTEDSFIATFIDKQSGEVYNFNSNVAEASVLPAIIIGHVVRLGIQWVIKNIAKKHLTNAVKGLSNQIKKKSASKASTGRQTARNLEEQLAMKSVLSSPLSGAREVVSKSKMNDKRWLGSKGWSKYQRTFKTGKGTVNIHFNYNSRTKKFDDFKFK